jgi:hypothetical protein
MLDNISHRNRQPQPETEGFALHQFRQDFVRQPRWIHLGEKTSQTDV